MNIRVYIYFHCCIHILSILLSIAGTRPTWLSFYIRTYIFENVYKREISPLSSYSSSISRTVAKETMKITFPPSHTIYTRELAPIIRAIIVCFLINNKRTTSSSLREVALVILYKVRYILDALSARIFKVENKMVYITSQYYTV